MSLLLAALALPAAAFAHREDEYLQATLVAIEPSGVRLQVNLTPGIAAAEEVIARIDRNRDGTISRSEAAAYAEALRRDLSLRLDGHVLEVNLTHSMFVPPEEIRTGTAILRMEFAAVFTPLSPGVHKLTLENRHLAGVSVYLVNAVQPKLPAIRVTRQTRNDNQSVGVIEFAFLRSR